MGNGPIVIRKSMMPCAGSSSGVLCSYRTWFKRHYLIDRYDGGGFEWGQLDLSNFEGNVCPFCQAAVNSGFVRSRFQKVSHYVFECEVCGWWKVARIFQSGMPVEDVYVAVGQVKKFRVSDLDVPLLELRRFIDKRPDYVIDVHSTIFERLVRDCLRSAYPDADVIHVGGSGDRGIDVKLITAGGDTYLVQVKRRKRLLASESVDAVRSLNGVLFREGLAKGMVVSTAASFTPAARAEAGVKTLTEAKYEMKLIPFAEFMAMLRLPGPYLGKPWEQLLDRDDADFGDEDQALPATSEL